MYMLFFLPPPPTHPIKYWKENSQSSQLESFEVKNFMEQQLQLGKSRFLFSTAGALVVITV